MLCMEPKYLRKRSLKIKMRLPTEFKTVTLEIVAQVLPTKHYIQASSTPRYQSRHRVYPLNNTSKRQVVQSINHAAGQAQVSLKMHSVTSETCVD